MLNYNEVTQKKFIILDGAPYEVLASHVFRKQQRKPVNQTKLKNLITGKVTEYSFHQAETVEEAEIITRSIKYLYTKQGHSAGRQSEYWFCDEKDPRDRFELPDDLIGPQARFLKTNALVEALVFNDRVIGLRLPIKVDLAVKEAPPSVRGDTAQGGNKQVILETGASVNVPLFVNEGDVVRVNTETGAYVERVEKK